MLECPNILEKIEVPAKQLRNQPLFHPFNVDHRIDVYKYSYVPRVQLSCNIFLERTNADIFYDSIGKKKKNVLILLNVGLLMNMICFYDMVVCKP